MKDRVTDSTMIIQRQRDKGRKNTIEKTRAIRRHKIDRQHHGHNRTKRQTMLYKTLQRKLEQSEDIK